jgi:raffinose/stachyose/melibiose transport system substrate-binding protein
MTKTRFMKTICSVICASLVLGTALTGCSKSKEVASTQKKDEQITLTLLQWNNTLNPSGTFDIAAEYKKTHPNVTIQVENVKDSGEFEQTMKIRRAANQLPDIFTLKPYMLGNYAEFLTDMSDVPAAANNLFAKQFAVDGKVLGLPAETFNEFVWYKKSIFKEYNIEVPKTWDEFIAAAEKIKAGGKYIPILMGGKDAWPDYPFNEFMPALEANDGQLWNKMAKEDEPFAKDKPFYKAYTKIQKLYDAKVFGDDPLGMGYDQVKMMFGTKGAMIAAGQWALADLKKALNGDGSDIGAFLLPVREKASDKLNTITMVDLFMSTPKGGKNEKAAKEFINWYLTNEDTYKKFLKVSNVLPTQRNIKADIDACVNEAFQGVDINNIYYDGGNADFLKIQAATKFDVKKMGQDMMAGKNLDKMMDDLNKAWKAARSK